MEHPSISRAVATGPTGLVAAGPIFGRCGIFSPTIFEKVLDEQKG